MMNSERYGFPPFAVDKREGSLRREAEEIVPRPKTVSVLSLRTTWTGSKQRRAA